MTLIILLQLHPTKVGMCKVATEQSVPDIEVLETGKMAKKKDLSDWQGPNSDGLSTWWTNNRVMGAKSSCVGGLG